MRNRGNYSLGSTLRANASSSPTLFTSGIAGIGAGAVYELMLCRGNLSVVNWERRRWPGEPCRLSTTHELSARKLDRTRLGFFVLLKTAAFSDSLIA
jgi:hypothetical protein